MKRQPKLRPGQFVGSLLVLKQLPTLKSGTPTLRKRWYVKCCCNNFLTVPEFYLIRKDPKTHCGCLQKVSQYKGLEPFRGVWLMMRTRCYDPNHVGYEHYGARNVKVCEPWLNDPDGFLQFVKDMGERPKNWTLDRINVNGWYCANNTRWASWKVQNSNKRGYSPNSPAGLRASRCDSCPFRTKLPTNADANAPSSIREGVEDSSGSRDDISRKG